MRNVTIPAGELASSARILASALGHELVEVMASDTLIYIRCQQCERYGIFVRVTDDLDAPKWDAHARGLWAGGGCLPY